MYGLPIYVTFKLLYRYDQFYFKECFLLMMYFECLRVFSAIKFFVLYEFLVNSFNVFFYQIVAI